MRYKWTLLAMLWGIVFFNYADRHALAAVIPLLREAWHRTPVQEGMLGSAFAWTYGLSSPFAGRLVDRIRRRVALLGGFQIWSAVCVATAFAPGIRSLLALRAAEGLGETAYFPASVSLISDHHDERTRSRALGLHQTGVYAGTIGGTTVAALLAQHYGWRSPFLVFGIAGIALGIVLHFFIREPERRARDEHASFATALKAILATPSAIALLLAFVCANAVAAVLLFWMPTYVHDHFKQNLAFAGFTASFFAQSGSFAGAIFGGWSADAATRRHRSGRMIVQGGALLLGLPFVVLTVAFLGWGFFKGMYDANIFASMFDVTPPEIRGTVVGVMNMAGWLFGAGTAPVLIGYLAERTALATAIFPAPPVYGVAAVLLFVAAARNRPSHFTKSTS